jgi:hypothetical protein
MRKEDKPTSPRLTEINSFVLISTIFNIGDLRLDASLYTLQKNLMQLNVFLLLLNVPG